MSVCKSDITREIESEFGVKEAYSGKGRVNACKFN